MTSTMLNNDLNYVFKEVPYPFQGTKDEAKTLIRDLLNEHLNESISAPFFNEAQDLEEIKADLPDGWEIELNEDSRQPKSTLRIVIYNKYKEADRNSGEDFDSVKLKATNLYGYTWVVSEIEVADEEYEEMPLELNSAEGESPVGIVLCGGYDEEFYGDYDELEITFTDQGYVIPEENLDGLVDDIFTDWR